MTPPNLVDRESRFLQTPLWGHDLLRHAASMLKALVMAGMKTSFWLGGSAMSAAKLSTRAKLITLIMSLAQ